MSKTPSKRKKKITKHNFC